MPPSGRPQSSCHWRNRARRPAIIPGASMPSDPYALLELETDATDAEVKAAYRRLAALYHPDRNPGFQAAATERLKQLNEAYTLITALRRQHPESSGPTAASHRPDKGSGQDAERTRAQDDDPADSRRENRRSHKSIAAALARTGFLVGPRDEDHIVIDVAVSMLPGQADIIACTPYVEVSSTLKYPHSKHQARFLRALPIDLGVSLGGGGLGSTARPSATKVVICTSDVLLWTTSEFGIGDGVVVEECITGHTIPLAEILGAVVRKRRRVDILVEEGPTVTFRTTPEAAAALSRAVDGAAGSA